VVRAPHSPQNVGLLAAGELAAAAAGALIAGFGALHRMHFGIAP
jgi:hypothetical protein